MKERPEELDGPVQDECDALARDFMNWTLERIITSSGKDWYWCERAPDGSAYPHGKRAVLWEQWFPHGLWQHTGMVIDELKDRGVRLYTMQATERTRVMLIDEQDKSLFGGGDGVTLQEAIVQAVLTAIGFEPRKGKDDAEDSVHNP